MESKCEACEARPTGIAGHPHLFTESFYSQDVVFSCDGCGTRWSRSYAGDSVFVWTELDAKTGAPEARVGLSLPGR